MGFTRVTLKAVLSTHHLSCLLLLHNQPSNKQIQKFVGSGRHTTEETQISPTGGLVSTIQGIVK